jgi:heme ABC exporter ATP-binding subunit CcmA
MNAIEVGKLDKRYGAVRALRGVSFELAASTVTLVAGPNGAGKSTLLRVLACLTRPTAGSVRIFGRELFGRDGPALRSQIGWLGPDSGLYADLTVDENLAFTAQLHGCDRALQEWAVEELGLAAVRHRRVRTLSQGYRRRAGLARALLPGPTLLLLDEPWNGLDEEASERLTKVLQGHRSGGGTLVVAAHAVAAARELADRVLHLQRGALQTIEAHLPEGGGA